MHRMVEELKTEHAQALDQERVKHEETRDNYAQAPDEAGAQQEETGKTKMQFTGTNIEDMDEERWGLKNYHVQALNGCHRK